MRVTELLPFLYGKGDLFQYAVMFSSGRGDAHAYLRKLFLLATLIVLLRRSQRIDAQLFKRYVILLRNLMELLEAIHYLLRDSASAFRRQPVRLMLQRMIG